MNRLEICDAAKQFAQQLDAMSMSGDVTPLLTPENLVIGEKSLSLKNTAMVPGAPVGIFPGFTAPEVYMGQHSMASGVYFVGAAMVVLATGAPPPDARMRTAGQPAMPGDDALAQLVNQMLEMDPAKRMGNYKALANSLGAVYGMMQSAAPTAPVPESAKAAEAPVARVEAPAAAAVPEAAKAPPQAAPKETAPVAAPVVPPVSPVSAPNVPPPSAGSTVPPPSAGGPMSGPPVQGVPPVQPGPGMGAPPPYGAPPAGPYGAPAPGMPPMQGAQVPPAPPKPKKKRTGLKIGIIAAAVVLLLGGAFLTYTLVQQSSAETAYTEGDYQKYVSAMDMTPWIKGGEENEQRYEYASARLLEDEGDREGALEKYDGLGSFEDCAARANSIRYVMAGEMLDKGDLRGSLQLYKGLGSYREDGGRRSDDIAYEIESYLEADELTDPVDRFYAFKDLGDFLDSASKADAAASGVYDEARELFGTKDYSGAQSLFEAVSSYQDAERWAYACQLAQNSGSYSDLWELEALEAEIGVPIGDIVLNGSYIRYFLDGTWNSTDGAGSFWVDNWNSTFDFDIAIGEGTYDFEDNALRPRAANGNLIVFEYVSFNELNVTIEGHGTFRYVRA